MTTCFGYTRVSTAKQGERGVSLQEQKQAIERYAGHHELDVVEWFEERETAAKQGRPEFARMLRLLRRGKARGVIIHKVDRSARNFLDWGRLSDLADNGVEVHFANESVDLSTRGGRLSADIQAAVAVDYIRNLREEVRKGIYGRLKQGIYPFGAPLGYLNRGGGNLKEIDPIRGPLVRQAFERYATGSYSLHSLADELYRDGLRNSQGQPVNKNALSRLLNNPFYIGLLHLGATGETFQGKHLPLIPKSTFDAVQAILQGKTHRKVVKHDHLFRRTLRCRSCNRHLVGERQKGHVYYRCQKRGCPKTCVREETVDEEIRRELARISFGEDELDYLKSEVEAVAASLRYNKSESVEAYQLRLQKLDARLARLTDAYLDKEIDRELFEERKATLLDERATVRERVLDLEEGRVDPVGELVKWLELSSTALPSYEMASDATKREIVKTTTSNLSVQGKEVAVELSFPFSAIADRDDVSRCALRRDKPRTSSFVSGQRNSNKSSRHLVEQLFKWVRENPGAISVPRSSES